MNVTAAVKTLHEIMTDDSIVASSRVSAATNTINQGIKFAEIDNLIERMEVLEDKLLTEENED